MKALNYTIAGIAGMIFALAAALPAVAAESDAVDPRVAQMLAEVPGGVVVDPETAVWPELGMEFTVATATDAFARSAVGSCASGTICAYDRPNMGGTKLTFTGCGVLAVPGSFGTQSMADARASGYAQARNGSTVLATATAGSWTNVSGTTTNIRCLL
ncbi:hypothetical protein [Microbacterium sp. LWH10-1.2]|jgi:hypothetical protein|uniref:hypothetical protein n=1 Tax=unclassified Microbacterium TaxID=2609290 RepID=UPI0031387642